MAVILEAAVGISVEGFEVAAGTMVSAIGIMGRGIITHRVIAAGLS